jgi:uncharacterized protein YceH (UPF0502 family)
MTEKKEGAIPNVLYLNIHSKLREIAIKRYDKPVMPITEAEWRMFCWKVPTQLRHIVIREMIILNLVNKISQYEIEFLESKFKEDDLRDIYKMIGFTTK